MDDLDAAGIAGEVGFAGFAELDVTCLEGEESVVAANPDVPSGKDAGTALAHENRARFGQIAIVEFRTEIFWIGIAKVFCGASRFLMGHLN